MPRAARIWILTASFRSECRFLEIGIHVVTPEGIISFFAFFAEYNSSGHRRDVAFALKELQRGDVEGC
jgi:hypothetical protein